MAIKFLFSAAAIIAAACASGEAARSQENNENPTVQALEGQSTGTTTERLNAAIQVLSKQLLQTIDLTKTYAITLPDENTSGVPADILGLISSTVQTALIKDSLSRIKIIDQRNLGEAWANAVEFNGADFEELVQSNSFDYLILVSARATANGIEISLQAIGASAENSGHTVSGTQMTAVEINWEEYVGFNPSGINDKLDLLLQKTGDAPAPEIASVNYIELGAKIEDGINYPNDKIIAEVGGRKYVAFDVFKVATNYGDDRVYISHTTDIDNDGYKDAIVMTTNMGNGTIPQHFILSYRGEGRFSIHDLGHSYEKSEIFSDGPRWNVRMKDHVGTDGTSGERTFSFSENAIAETSSDNASELSEVDFTYSEAAKHFDDIGTDPNGAVFQWNHDVTGDGQKEVISCALWQKWRLLVDCVIRDDKIYYVLQSLIPGDPPSGTALKVIFDELGKPKRLYFDYDEVELAQVSKYTLQSKTAAQFMQSEIQSNRETVQELLQHWDFYGGAIDADFGPGTMSALEKFFEAVERDGNFPGLGVHEMGSVLFYQLLNNIQGSSAAFPPMYR